MRHGIKNATEWDKLTLKEKIHEIKRLKADYREGHIQIPAIEAQINRLKDTIKKIDS